MTACLFAAALVTVPAADQRGARGRPRHAARYRADSAHRHGRFSSECGPDDDE